MKKLITILLVLASIFSFGQSVIVRSTGGNTVEDVRLMAGNNFFIPRYTDTTAANVQKGIDSLGAIIFTYDVNTFWIRVGNPKHWQQGSGGGTVLPDGVYSGGQVAYAGSGYDYIVSAATYVLNGVIYNSPQDTVTLDPADATFDRVDVIGLTNAGVAGKVTGVPAANPQEPSINPQTFIRRSIVTVVANTLTPPNIDQSIIYDEGAGEPTEWTPTSEGNTDFLDVLDPYHLTIAALTVAINPGQRIKFTNNDTINSGARQSLVIFTKLLQPLSGTQNLNVQLVFQGNPVSILLPLTKYGLLRNLTTSYQMAAIPFTEFGNASILFDEVDIIPSGDSPFPFFYNDYIQMQSGLSIIYSQQNAFTSIIDEAGAAVIAESPNSLVNVIGTTGILITADNSTKTLQIDGVELIRNDIFFNAVQTPAAINIDRYIHTQDALTESGVLSIHGNQSGLAALVNFESANTNCCAFGTYNYYNVLENLSPNAVNHSLIGIRLGRGRSSYFESAFIDYMYDGATAATSHVGIGFVDPTNSPIPFVFGADSTFKILRPAIGGDNSFKIDVYGKARFLDAIQANYLTAGARITDSSYLWKKAIDSLITASISGGSVTSVATNTATGITGGTITTTGTLAIDTTTVIPTKAYVNNQIALNGTFYNANVGSSYRWAIPGTINIKTLRVLNGILADSVTANTLSIQVDSSIYATKGFVNSVAGGGGFTGVTSVSVANANGFNGTVATSTTTPVITIIATPSGVLKSNGTAISAATVGTDYSVGTSALATGILKSTTATGALSIAVAGDFPTLNQNTTGTAATITGVSTVAHGGTGLATLTAYGLMVAGTTATGNMQQVSGTGTAGQVLTSNGAAALPTWQAPATGVASITGTANQVIASAATGAVTLSLPQSIATTSSPTFTSLTVGGTAATTPLTFVTNTDAAASAGRWYYNTTRLGFSLAATILRLPLTNDVAPTAGQSIFGNGATYTVGTYSALNNSLLVVPSATGVTFRTNSIVQTLSGTSVTMNINSGENAQWTLTATGSSLAITNPIAGRTYYVNVVQDGTGSRTITTYPAGTLWYSGTAPVLKTTPAANNLLAFYYNGSNYYGYDWGSGGASGFANPMTTLGDAIYGGASGVATRLAGNTTANVRVLTQTGTGVVSAAPSWQDTFTGLTNFATLDFPNTGAQASSELTITVTGAAVGDVVDVGTGVNNANSTYTARVSAVNTVSIRFNNYSAAAINPASGSFKVIVWR